MNLDKKHCVPQELYIRRVVSVSRPGSDEPYRLVVCMFKEQSALFHEQRYKQIDTTFKGTQTAMELEITSWDHNHELGTCMYSATSRQCLTGFSLDPHSGIPEWAGLRHS